MSLVSRLAVMTSKAWGQFTNAVPNIGGNYLYSWAGTLAADGSGNGRYGNYLIGNGTTGFTQTYTRFFVGDGSTSAVLNYAVSQENLYVIDGSGALWSAGANGVGQLGDGTTTGNSSPTQIGTLTNWASISANGGTPASVASIKTNNTLWTWGYGIAGVLGSGATTNRSSPVQVGTLTDWAKVSVGYSYMLSVKTDGTLWSWGSGANGRLGSGATTNRSSPVQVGTLTNWASVSSGTSTSLAIKTDGTLWAWGDNSDGQLGDGTIVSKSSPIQIGSDTDWAYIGSGTDHSVATKTDGSVWAWGQPAGSTTRQLGAGGTVYVAGGAVSTPTALASFWKQNPGSDYNLSTATAVTVHAIAKNGALFYWGQKSAAAGDGSNTTTFESYPVQVDSGTTWSAVSSSFSFAIALKTNGTLWSWGLNSAGQLGQGDTTLRSRPVQVGTLTNWASISTSRQASYSVKTDGTLWAWGSGASGQLGDGTTVAKSSPVQIGTLTNWSKTSAGNAFVAAVKTDGTLWSWGLNSSGQLGDGTTANKSSPVQIGTLTNWAKVSVGENFVVATKTDGTLWSWGGNASGQLGDGTTADKSSPVQIGTLTNWATPRAGYDSAYGITTAGDLYAWGSGSFYKLFNTTTTSYSSPVQVQSGTVWTDVVAYNRAVYGLSGNTLYVQGQDSNTTNINLGYGAVNQALYPMQINTTAVMTEVSAGNTGSAGVDSSGRAYIWGQASAGASVNSEFYSPSYYTNANTLGYSKPVVVLETVVNNATNGFLQRGYLNFSGESGTLVDFITGTTLSSNYRTPQRQPKLTRINKFGLTANGGIGIASDRTLYAWGANTNGIYGDGTTISDNSYPIQVSSAKWLDFRTEKDVVTAVKSDGTLYQWGGPQDAATTALGVVSNASNAATPQTYGFIVPTSVAGGSNLPSAVGTNEGWMLYVEGNKLYAVGDNTYGQLGNGSTVSNVSNPIQIGTLTNWAKVSAGARNSYAVKTDGTAWAWGEGTQGKLGTGSTVSRSSPVQIGTLTNWSVLVAGAYFCMALKTDGTLWGWGRNDNGQLGDGTTVDKSSPVQVGTLTTWAAVTATSDNTYALKTDGTLWAWGSGSFGALGDGTNVDKSSPIQVGTLTDWIKVKGTGSSHIAAQRSGGSVWVWGRNNAGQLGDGTTSNKSSPIQIGTLTGYLDVVASGLNTFFIRSNGVMFSTGSNDFGQLGDGTTVSKSSPVQVATDTFTEVYGAEVGNIALGQVGTQTRLFVWGRLNRVGYNPAASVSSPVQIITGEWKTPFVKADGTLWTWGSNISGACAVGVTGTSTLNPYINHPVQVGTLTDWAFVAKNSVANAMIALKTDGTLWGAGDSRVNGAAANRSSPVQIGTVTTWSSIALGAGAAIGLRTDGSLWTWGNGTNGSLGNGSTTSVSVPTQIGTLTWTKVGAVDYTMYAIRSDGTLWAWGLNDTGQFGNGATVNRSSPVQVGTLTTWKDLPYNTYTTDLAGAGYE